MRKRKIFLCFYAFFLLSYTETIAQDVVVAEESSGVVQVEVFPAGTYMVKARGSDGTDAIIASLHVATAMAPIDVVGCWSALMVNVAEKGSGNLSYETVFENQNVTPNNGQVYSVSSANFG